MKEKREEHYRNVRSIKRGGLQVKIRMRELK